jgi:hypothetical protein
MQTFPFIKLLIAFPMLFIIFISLDFDNNHSFIIPFTL